MLSIKFTKSLKILKISALNIFVLNITIAILIIIYLFNIIYKVLNLNVNNWYTSNIIPITI